MSVTVYFIISLLVLGVIFTVYGIKMAEVDEGHLEEQFDREAFSKPSGWKVGKMPESLRENPVSSPRVSDGTSLFPHDKKFINPPAKATKAKN